jgi:alcohol dehydrogenase YqhD (iron-dependent ADH family)
MNPFVYCNPVNVIFGAGKLSEAGTEAAKLGKKAIIVSYKDESVTGILDRIRSSFDKVGVEHISFLEITPNPAIETIAKGVEQAKAFGADMVVGVGGGSAMDAAKALAAGVLYTHGDLWNMVYASHSNVTTCPPEAALPLLLIPTLSATGSEMNRCAVVSSETRKQKSYIWSDCLLAKTAILDPELTYTLPKFQTACGAIDAISHVLEIFINGQDKSDLLHEFQISVIRTIVKNLPIAYENPTDEDSRTELMWAATCGINGWASPGDAWTPIHQVGHVLTALYGINHGSSLAVLMPAWMNYFKRIKPAPYERFEREVMSIADFKAFMSRFGLPTSLSEAGLTEENIPAIVQGAKDVAFNADGVLSCNPPVTTEMLIDVLKEAL